MAATALTCPVFSAMSTITTGAISAMARQLKVGPVKSGSPTQSASPTGPKSISPATAATR